jgi:sterol 24-C-methyltransferase
MREHGVKPWSKDAYDADNAEHRRIRQEILIGNGLPTARTCVEVLDAMRKAGFEVTEEVDLVKSADVTWYEPIDPYRFWVPWWGCTS